MITIRRSQLLPAAACDVVDELHATRHSPSSLSALAALHDRNGQRAKASYLIDRIAKDEAHDRPASLRARMEVANRALADGHDIAATKGFLGIFGSRLVVPRELGLLTARRARQHAYYALGDAYEFGRQRLPRDLDKARGYYARAVSPEANEPPHPRAALALAEILLGGAAARQPCHTSDMSAAPVSALSHSASLVRALTTPASVGPRQQDGHQRRRRPRHRTAQPPASRTASLLAIASPSADRHEPARLPSAAGLHQAPVPQGDRRLAPRHAHAGLGAPARPRRGRGQRPGYAALRRQRRQGVRPIRLCAWA